MKLNNKYIYINDAQVSLLLNETFSKITPSVGIIGTVSVLGISIIHNCNCTALSHSHINILPRSTWHRKRADCQRPRWQPWNALQTTLEWMTPPWNPIGGRCTVPTADNWEPSSIFEPFSLRFMILGLFPHDTENNNKSYNINNRITWFKK